MMKDIGEKWESPIFEEKNKKYGGKLSYTGQITFLKNALKPFC